MSNDKEVRRWLGTEEDHGHFLPLEEVKQWHRQHYKNAVEVVEASAYDALKAELEILKSKASQFESTLKETMKARDKAEEELSWYKSGDVHSCHANCQKPGCVQRRRLEEAEKVIEFYANATEFELGCNEEEPKADGRPFTGPARAYLEKWDRR